MLYRFDRFQVSVLFSQRSSAVESRRGTDLRLGILFYFFSDWSISYPLPQPVVDPGTPSPTQVCAQQVSLLFLSPTYPKMYGTVRTEQRQSLGVWAPAFSAAMRDTVKDGRHSITAAGLNSVTSAAIQV